MSDREINEFLSGVVGVVEANSFETLCLWEDYHEQRKVSWEQRLDGLGETVGHLGSMPVHLSLCINTVDGHKLLFIDATSQVVDHRLIEKWLAETLPKSAMRDSVPVRVNKVNAMNFHNVFPRNRIKSAA